MNELDLEKNRWTDNKSLVFTYPIPSRKKVCPWDIYSMQSWVFPDWDCDVEEIQEIVFYEYD